MVSLSGLITPSGGRKYDSYFKDKEIEAQMKASHLLKAALRLEHGCVQPQTCILLSWWESNWTGGHRSTLVFPEHPVLGFLQRVSAISQIVLMTRAWGYLNNQFLFPFALQPATEPQGCYRPSAGENLCVLVYMCACMYTCANDLWNHRQPLLAFSLPTLLPLCHHPSSSHPLENGCFLLWGKRGWASQEKS